jgi:hypothetical protein
MKNEHKDFAKLRAFIPLLTQYKSPVTESEIEEISRCALDGGYKLNADAVVNAIGQEILFCKDFDLAKIVLEDN